MRLRHLLVLAASGVALSTGAVLAQTAPLAAIPAPPATTSVKASDAPAGVYNIDPRHTAVTWRIRHAGLSLYTARFDKIAGKLTFDPAAPEKSSIEATIDANSVSTGVLNAQGERAFDAEVGGTFLGGKENPNITFKSTGIKLTGAQTGLVSGDLTVKGVTKPVVLDVKFEGGKLNVQNQKYKLAFTARTIIDRTQFNIVGGPIDTQASKEAEIIVTSELTQQ
jgi:polyisoprenoid-binding protein YceI